jgi:acyl-CoA thioesterase
VSDARPISSHPFADLIGLSTSEQRPGYSRCSLTVEDKHLNPHQVVHGAVIYALADTGMGMALYPSLSEGEICATIEIKINYFKPVTTGPLHCTSEVLNRGRTVANIESRVYVGDTLVAQANGNYAIFKPRGTAMGSKQPA